MRKMYSEKQVLKTVEEVAQTEGLKVFENIVDKDGHKRFIEGDIELYTTHEGITKTYGKWSLSGSHLLIVLCLTLENGATISNSQNLSSEIKLPSYIANKIVPTWSIVVDFKNLNARDSSWGTQALNVFLAQNSATKDLSIISASNLTLSAERFIRISFDLLIDNE